MTLDMPVLQNLVDMCQRSGAETFFTVQFPDGTTKTIDVNLVWAEIHRNFRAIEHFFEMRRAGE